MESIKKFLMIMRKRLLFTTIIVICMLCACAKEEKTVADDMSIEEGSTATTEAAASEETSEIANIAENDVAVFHSYDEFIEKINYLIGVMETSDSDTFLDEAMRYEWFTYPVYLDFTKRTDQFGYLQVDIDGDGVDEFLLGDIGSEDGSYDIESMYTLKDGIVYVVFEESERNFYKIYEEGIIEHNFAYPNSLYGVEYFKYTAGKQEFIEGIYNGIIRSPDDEYQINYWYSDRFPWSYEGSWDDERYSDSASQERVLTEEEYHEMWDELENRYCKQEMQLKLHLFKEGQ